MLYCRSPSPTYSTNWKFFFCRGCFSQVCDFRIKDNFMLNLVPNPDIERKHWRISFTTWLMNPFLGLGRPLDDNEILGSLQAVDGHLVAGLEYPYPGSNNAMMAHKIANYLKLKKVIYLPKPLRIFSYPCFNLRKFHQLNNFQPSLSISVGFAEICN